MARDYWFAFGGGTTTTNSGLNPTFITFMNDLGTGFAAPSITEIASKGLYLSQYNATQTIVFTLDGATTGLAATDRYINGVFDPSDTFGGTLTAIGNSSIALGTTTISYLSNQSTGFTGIANSLIGLGNSLSTIGLAIGTTASSYGSTSVDPVDIYGFLKRNQEMTEGNKTYTKATGLLDYFIRGGATLLREKTVSDTSTNTTTT